jgi:hypothetical protein
MGFRFDLVDLSSGMFVGLGLDLVMDWLILDRACSCS